METREAYNLKFAVLVCGPLPEPFLVRLTTGDFVGAIFNSKQHPMQWSDHCRSRSALGSGRYLNTKEKAVLDKMSR